MTKFMALMAMCLLATACGTSSDAGKSVAIPPVTMSCGASACKTGTNMYAYMYITAYACSESSIDFSVAASSSENVTCTVSGGCVATFTDWVNSTGGVTTTVPTNTYYLCGVVGPTSWTGSWAGNAVAVGQATGQKITDTTTALGVTDYVNGSSY